jgi:hypothetical protein
VNNEDDIEQAEAERKKKERAARIADVPPVVFVGDPNQHMSIRAKKKATSFPIGRPFRIKLIYHLYLETEGRSCWYCYSSL